MKQNKNFNAVFYAALCFNVLMLLFFVVFILNVKYVFSENLCSYLFNPNFLDFVEKVTGYLAGFFPFALPHDFLQESNRRVFNNMIASFQYFDVLIGCIFLNIVNCFFIEKFCKNKNYKIVSTILVLTVVPFIVYNIFIFHLTYEYFLLFLSGYMLAYFLNNNINIKKLKYVLLVPFVNIFFFTSHVLRYISGTKNKAYGIIRFYSPFVMMSVLVSVFIFTQIKPLDNSPYISNKCIVKGESSGIAINPNTDDVVVSLYKDIIFLKHKKKIARFTTLIQNVLFNDKKNEYYCFDSGELTFYVFDGNDLSIKKISKLPPDYDLAQIALCERISFDNETNTISLITEEGSFYLIDMTTFKVKDIKSLFFGNDSITYNPFKKEYILSFWTNSQYLISYSLRDENTENRISGIKTSYLHGYVTVSVRNKEIYLAFPQKGRIYVYDAVTYRLKRKIKSLYMVKSLHYNEKYNILIALSYNTGYMDVFSMDGGKDNLIDRQFIGYKLRTARLHPDGKTVFIASAFGIFKTSIKNTTPLTKIEIYFRQFYPGIYENFLSSDFYKFFARH